MKAELDLKTAGIALLAGAVSPWLGEAQLCEMVRQPAAGFPSYHCRCSSHRRLQDH